jgi:hypothetical protein
VAGRCHRDLPHKQSKLASAAIEARTDAWTWRQVQSSSLCLGLDAGNPRYVIDISRTLQQ